jgi:hypothetical protein
MQLGIFEVLHQVENAPTKEDKILLLRQHWSQALQDLLQGAFDQRIQWLLPKGPVPFLPSPGAAGLENALQFETRKMYLFVKGGHADLKQPRRETIFIQLLESIHPHDANILLEIKDKKWEIKGVTPEIFQAAYPNVPIIPIEKPAEAKAADSKRNAAPKAVDKPSPVGNEILDTGSDLDDLILSNEGVELDDSPSADVTQETAEAVTKVKKGRKK